MDNKEHKVRRLSAVMFTDIVGYTALMQGDETVAMHLRTRHRQVFEQQHALHHGEIIQYYGDGTLSVFKSAVESVKCAIAIQRLLLAGDRVPLRIGLHMGDIVFDGTEVYGDGVNCASRIQSLGIAGSILVSGKLNDELVNQPGILTQSLGNFRLKNINGSVEIFAVINEGVTVPQPHELKGKEKADHQTIAVLPFVNRSTNEETEYFSDGITEEIINALSKIKYLRVTSRTSSFFFKNRDVTIKEIARELNVSALLEGSVRLSGDHLRITAQLVDAGEDFHFWSETWDRKMENIFQIQDEISLAIAHKLREHFGHFEIQDHLVVKQTDNLGAYEYSLKAKFYFNRVNGEDTRTAISLYEKALELDPHHTESYLGLAECYGFMATTGFMPFAEAWDKSAQLTRKAHLLNDQLPAVHYQLANLSCFAKGDFRGSVEQAATALRLNPSYVEAHQFMGYLRTISGEQESALHHLDIAAGLDPLSYLTIFYNAFYDYMAGDYESGLEKSNKCLAENPKNIAANMVRCHCLLMLGRFNDVIEYLDDTPPGTILPGDKAGLAALAYTLKKDTARAGEIVRSLEQPEGVSPFNAASYLFLIYAVSGKTEQAFEWIRWAIENKYPLLLLRFGDPLAGAIKSDPRYQEFKQLIFADPDGQDL